MRRLLTATLFFVSFTLLPLQADAVYDLIVQGQDQLYSVRFDMAAASFDKAIAADRNDPRGYFFRSTLHLWSYLFDRRPEQLTQFMRLTDQTIAVATKRLKAQPRDVDGQLFLGMAYGYRALANARAENITAAAMSGKSCYERLDALVRSNPAATDAYLGLGLFHVLFGTVPKAAQFLGSMGGIKGDAKLGLKEIARVAEKGRYFANDARLIQSMLTIYYYNDLEKGAKQLSSIASKYPRNVALRYVLGAAYLQQGALDRAQPQFQAVVREANPDFRIFTDLSLARLGQLHFARNDFNAARTSLQQFLLRTREKDFTPTAWYLLGLCFEIGGSREKAIQSYRKAVEVKGGGAPEDWASRRRATELITTPLGASGIALVRGMNDIDARRGDAALKEASAVLTRGKPNVEQAAVAWYITGRAQQLKGDHRTAIQAFQRALRGGRHDESWVVPYSLYYTSESYRRLGDEKLRRQNLDLARRYNGYDNEIQLRFLIERDVTLID